MINLDKIVLDPHQQEIVDSAEEKILIRAGAGSGKTTVLIAAILEHHRKFPDEQLAAITFTNEAVHEIATRLSYIDSRQIQVTTIHKWAARQLYELAARYGFQVEILQDMDVAAILKKIMTAAHARKGKRPPTDKDVSIALSYVMGNKNMDISAAYKNMLFNYNNLYIAYKQTHDLYDSTDYPLYLRNKLEEYDEKIFIDALFVDEFQDVDDNQLAVFNRVIASKKIYIGDPWQSIYIFRGAEGEVFNLLPDFKLYKLKYNYRSEQVIADYASQMYQKMLIHLAMNVEEFLIDTSATISKVLSSGIIARPNDGQVCVEHPFSGASIFAKTNQIYDNINEGKYHFLLKQALKEGAQILCRTNKEKKLIQSCGYFNVSTIHGAKGLEYDKVIVIDFACKSLEDVNVAYVGITRARKELYIASSMDLEEVLTHGG